MPRYAYQPFDYVKPPELDGRDRGRYPVAIIGAGPIGLALAIDLALRGVGSVVLDDNDVVSVGSRAICWSKRTLEIFDRLGVGERMLDKGVTWQTGRLFHRSDEVYAFDLLPEAGHKYPAFINLQQYYVEEYLIERARDFPDLIDLRFKNAVTDHSDRGDFVSLTVETPDGRYELDARYCVACDGAGSPTRQRMGLAFEGQTFDEHFLIVDVEMETSPFDDAETPERWFWFEPEFHPGQSALLHKQPDNIYRIDLQLGPDADPDAELREDQVVARIAAIVGGRPFSLDWMSVYRFRCAKLDRFVHGRVIFAGDSAHVVSPFGARGGNGGIQDIDNLGWKLAAVVTGNAPERLLETYADERGHGSAENILHSSRATNFMTPKSDAEKLFRDAVLALAHEHGFARRLINSGRLSQPCSLAGFALQTDTDIAPLRPGTAIVDAPLRGTMGDTWLISEVQGAFTLVGFGGGILPDLPGLRRIGIDQSAADYPVFTSSGGHAAARYGQGLAYLFRPDGHVAAVFSTRGGGDIRTACGHALRRAMGERTKS